MPVASSWDDAAERRVEIPPPCSCSECSCARPTKGGDDICTRCLMEEHGMEAEPEFD